MGAIPWQILACLSLSSQLLLFPTISSAFCFLILSGYIGHLHKASHIKEAVAVKFKICT
jgi:hypothetical protein